MYQIILPMSYLPSAGFPDLSLNSLEIQNEKGTVSKKIGIEKSACYSQFPTGVDTPHHAEPRGEASGSVRRQKEYGENTNERLSCGFCRKVWVRQGKQAQQI